MSSNASLDALMADVLTSDYNQAQTKQSHPFVMRTFAVLSAAGTALILALGVNMVRENAAQSALTRDELIKRVQTADHRVSLLEQQAKQAQRDYESAQQAKLSGTSLGQQAQDRLTLLSGAVGFTAVIGNGIELKVDDAPVDVTAPNDAATPGRVQDRDLQLVVNGLWQSGATAIAINDRRISSTTAIRSAGDAILVNYRPLSPPYRVTAIAPNADKVAAKFRDGSASLLLEQLAERYGVVWELNTIGQTTIPAAPDDNNGGGAQ